MKIKLPNCIRPLELNEKLLDSSEINKATSLEKWGICKLLEHVRTSEDFSFDTTMLLDHRLKTILNS